MKEIDVVLGLVHHEGQYLFLQRRDPVKMWDKKWEFPGGKPNPEEDHEVAIKREVKEESGLDVEIDDYFGMEPWDWNMEDGSILRVYLYLYHCTAFHKDVVTERDKTYGHAWLDPDSIRSMDCLEANVHIFEKYVIER